MTREGDGLLAVLGIAADASAMSEAALAGDFDEARFRAQLIRDAAVIARLPGVVSAAGDVLGSLGAFGTPPDPGYGTDMLRVADEIDRIRL